jgi:hypothetical protein
MVDIVTRAGKGSPLTNNEVDANFTNLAEVSGVTGEPMGHEDRTTSTISFNASTRTFTIAPVSGSFTVWCKGKKVVVSSAQTVTIPNTTGMHSIYYDANGTLSSKIGYFTFSTEAPTAYVYWNATTGAAPYFGDERHGVVLDWQTHEYLHRTRGAAIANGFLASGYTLNNSATDAATQIAIESGTFFDEDMKIDIVSTATPTAGTYQQNLLFPAKIPVLHLQGTSWVMDAPTNFPFRQGTSRPQYNSFSGGVWSTADVGNNQHATTWILATNNLTYPVIAIIGQSATDNLGEAEAFSFADLTLTGFPSVEFRPLYKLIYKASNGYENSVNAQLVSIVDLRSISAVGSVANPATDHGNLSGLSDDDHPQYLSVDTVRGTLTAAVKASFLPSQTDNAGKFLTTDATSTSWAALTSGNITTALGFTPYNATNPAGYITGITSGNVTTALGFTPYNATNPSGFVTAAGARGAISVTGAGSYDSATGVINIVGGVTSFNTRTGAITLSSADVTTALGFTPYNNTNPNGFLTGITSTQVTTALGYTPYNSSNPSGYITGITSGMVTTALGFTPYNNSNPSGYITNSALSGYLTSASAASTYLPLAGGTLTGAVSWGTSLPNAKRIIGIYQSGNFFSGIGMDASNAGVRIAGDGGAGTLLDVGQYSTDGNYTWTSRLLVSTSYASFNGSTILHAGNYNSYSPTLTGGGASGTWGINVTGTASSENLGTVTARSGYTGSAVNLANGANRYQGHFYYDPYDPAGNHYPHFTDGGNASGVKINWRLYTGGTNSVTHYWGVDTTQFVTKLESTVRVDSPIFYDRNDTSYYVDPNSGSRLVHIFAGNVASSNDGSWNARMNLVGSSHARLDVVSNSDGIITTMYSHTGQGVGKIGTYSNHPLTLMAQGASDGGYVYSGSLRSPIFYDSDDTSYYVNPNSVTRLYSTSVYAGNEASNTGANGSTEGFILRGNYNSNTWAKKFHNYDNGSGIQLYLAETIGASAWSTIQGWGTGLGYTSRVFGSFRANETYGTIFYDADNTAYYIDPTGSSQVSGSNFYFGSKGQIYDDGNFHIDGRNSPVWINSLSNEPIYLNNQTSGHTVMGNSARSPIFYDSNDTAYYCDPNSQSRLYGLKLGTGANFVADPSYSLQISQGSRYLIAINNSSYSSNYYPWLVNDASDGVGGLIVHFNAIGDRFFFNYDGIGRTTGSWRAPIFYDSDNTGFYVDPSAATSAIFSGSVDARTHNYAGVLVNSSGTGSAGSSIAIQQVTAEGWTGLFVDYEPNAGWGLYHDNPNNYFCITAESTAGNFRSFTVPSRYSGNRTAYEKIRFDQNNGDIISGNIAYAYGSMRSPIFYDNNDTGFYLDPQGGSRLNALSLNSVSITAGVTSLTNAPIVTQQVQVGTTNTWLPMTYQRALHSGGYITHLNTGLYKSASAWGDNVTGWYAALGGSDSSPTMEWRLTYGTYIYNSNGYVSTSGSFRSSLFYDHDDTAYYCNPNSFSQLSYANLNAAPGGRTLSLGGDETNRVLDDAARASLVINATYYPHFYINATANNGNTNHGAVFSMTGNLSGGGYRRWGMGIANTDPDCWSWGYYDNQPNPHYGVGGTFGYTGTNSKMWLNTGGSLWTTGDMRTPIFYDSNNTGYYTDPASTSNLYDLTITGASHKYLYINPGNGHEAMVRYNGGSGSGWYVGKRTANVIVGTESFHFYSEAAAASVSGIDTSGNVFASGSSRAPIFYDSNDTTYYVDPASGTYLFGGVQNNGAHGSSWIQNRLLAGNNGASTGEVQLRMWCSEPGVSWDWAGFGYNVLNDGGSPGGFGRPNTSFGQAYMRMTPDGDWLFYNVTRAAARYMTMQLHQTGYVTATQSSRAPIFYDSDDTGYYVNPNSITSLRTIGSWRSNSDSWDGEFTGKIQYHSNSWYLQFLSNMFFRNAGGTNVMNCDSAGNVTFSGNVTAYSDARIKENVVTIDSALDKVLKLRGVYYNKIGNPERRVGVIAQEVETVLPEVVRSVSDTNPSTGETQELLAVDYGNIAGLLIEATKEQNQEVVDLRNRVAQLESLIHKLIGD